MLSPPLLRKCGTRPINRREHPMKFAFMSFSCPALTLDEMLSLAAELGYDGIEPRAGGGHVHGVELETSPAQRAEMRARAQESGVALCCLAVSCRYADPATAPAQVDATRRYIELAADLGIPRLRVFGGKIPDGVSRKAAIEGVAAALRSVAEQAADASVTLCLETHDDWCDPAHVAAAMERVDSPAVGVNWDIMHPIRAANATMDQAHETLRPWIRHVHVHDGTLRRDTLDFRPIGAGAIDHPRALALLHNHGYAGYLSGEWINWEPHEVHLPRELTTLQEIATEIQQKSETRD